MSNGHLICAIIPIAAITPIAAVTATVAIVLAVIALFAIAWRMIRPRYLLATPADEIHFAATLDGWDLALYRYRPQSLVAGREPIVLCHGMLSNRFNVDLDEEVSLARFLRQRGFDAWVMELRGHGGSRRSKERATSTPGSGVRGRFDWNIDDYIQRDLAAVIDHVRRATGADQVHWFGHSMGGMILYGACALPGTTRSIRSAVLTDAPASFATLRARVPLGRAYARLFPAVPPALVIPILGPLVWLLPDLMGPRYGIRDRKLMVSLLANAIIPWGSSRALLQFCDMLESGRFRSDGGGVDYEQGASRMDFPLLVLSSARKMLDERSILFGYEKSIAADKRYVRLSRAEGYSTDYTHSNLLLSASSPREVFPLIAQWYEDHSSA
ncbi:MAG TPA: alpha/beta fold hydrolase [Patescibacteria group bacterium]|nr:alpha/beta fold hydrolase [Patescibacteria group bacterium]